MATGFSFTHYAENIVLNQVFRNTAGTFPTSLTIGLFTAAPTESYTSGTPTGTEVSGGAYARQSIAFGAPVNQSSGAQIANSAQITFPVATANWGTVTYIGIFDQSGNLWAYGTLTTSQAINTGNQFVFPAGNITDLLD